METVKKLVIFFVGVGVGAGIMALIKRDRYEVIDYIPKKETKPEEPKEEKAEPEETVEKKSAEKIIDENSYTKSKIYTIIPDEVGMYDDYDEIELTYYIDGVLADDQANTYGIRDTIGESSINHFGDFDDNTLYVRNELLKCDYIVRLDQQPFYEIEDHPENLSPEE